MSLVLPYVNLNEKIGLAFSGGTESTLLAKAAIEKYGVDKIVFIMYTFNGSKYNNEEKLALDKQLFNKRVKSLGGKHKLFVGIEDKLPDERYFSLTRVAMRKLRMKYNARYILHGTNKAYYQILNLLFHNIINVDSIKEEISKRPEKYKAITNQYSDEQLALNITNPFDLEDWQALKENLYFYSPFYDIEKYQVFKLYQKYNMLEDLYSTYSCSTPSTKDKHCGECHNCLMRKKAFKLAGIEDKTIYIK